MKYKNIALVIGLISILSTVFMVSSSPDVSAKDDELSNRFISISDEPKPLTSRGQTASLHTIQPETCTVVFNSNAVRVCLESAEIWLCPAGLSNSAISREFPFTYNESIAYGVVVASRTTHCLFETLVETYPQDDGTVCSFVEDNIISCVDRDELEDSDDVNDANDSDDSSDPDDQFNNDGLEDGDSIPITFAG